MGEYCLRGSDEGVSAPVKLEASPSMNPLLKEEEAAGTTGIGIVYAGE